MTVKNTGIPLLIIGAAVLILCLLMLQLDGTGFAESMRMSESDHSHTYGGQWIGSLLKVMVIGGVAGGITLGVRRLFGRAGK